MGLLEPLKSMPLPPPESRPGMSVRSGVCVDGNSKASLQYGLGLAKATSTSSTWDQTYSSTWSSDSDIDPARFNTFMKQAIRPKWDGGRTNKCDGARSHGGGDHDRVDDNI